MARSLKPETSKVPEDGEAIVSLLERIKFEQALVALRMLLEAYPALRDNLPEELTRVVEVEVPAEAPEGASPENGVDQPVAQSQTGPQWFIALVERTAHPDAAELAQIGVIIRAMPQLIRKLLPLPKPQRKRFLKSLDGAMLETAELLQAVDATEPLKFLEFLDPTGLAEKLAGQGGAGKG